MIEYRLVSEPSVDLDVEAAFEWYENEQPGLGAEFLDSFAQLTTASPTDRSSTKSCAAAFVARF